MLNKKINKILKLFPYLSKKPKTHGNKEDKIMQYLNHFLFAKYIERLANEGEAYAEAICKAILLINFKGHRSFLTLNDAKILEQGKPATLLQVSNIINCPRESVRRKSHFLLQKKYIQKKGEHKYFVTKKWLDRSRGYLLLLQDSAKKKI